MHYDRAYVIGFPDARDRRLERFRRRARRAGLEAELWPAVNGAEVDLDRLREEGYLAPDFELRMPGCLGCLLSHVTLWEKIARRPESEVTLVCEDDLLVRRDFHRRLGAIPWSEVPGEWHMIKLAYHGADGVSVSPHLIRPTAARRGANSGTFCYLVNPRGATVLRSILIPYSNRQSMDVILRKNFDRLKVYLVRRPLGRELRLRYSVRKELNAIHGRKLKTIDRLYLPFSRRFLK